MAVYFEPRSPGWLDFVAPVAQQLLGGLVDGMFERDKQARMLKAEEQKAAGVSPEYIRLSVGLEDIEDIKADLDAALKASGGARRWQREKGL